MTKKKGQVSYVQSVFSQTPGMTFLWHTTFVSIKRINYDVLDNLAPYDHRYFSCYTEPFEHITYFTIIYSYYLATRNRQRGLTFYISCAERHIKKGGHTALY